MSDFTPGPWRIVEEQGRTDDDDEEVMVISQTGYIAVIISGLGEKEVLANAKLIAAAPKLYEKLKQVLVCLEASGEIMGDMQGMRNAIAAVEAR